MLDALLAILSSGTMIVLMFMLPLTFIATKVIDAWTLPKRQLHEVKMFELRDQSENRMIEEHRIDALHKQHGISNQKQLNTGRR